MVGTLIDDLWDPFAREMAAFDSYDEVPADIGEDAISYRRDRLEDDVVTYVTEHDGELAGYASVEYREPPPVFRRGPEANVEEFYVRSTHGGSRSPHNC